MLSQHDEAVIHKDSALPGLRILLDPDSLIALLNRKDASFNGQSLRLKYLRYKPNTNCLAAYTTAQDDRDIVIHAKTYSLRSKQKLKKSIPSELNPGVFVFEDFGIVVSLFPHDKKLKTLKQLHSEENRKKILRKLFLKQPGLWESELQNLAYKPERRFVAKLIKDGQPLAVLKFYTEDRYVAALYKTKAFVNHGPARIPKRLARSNRHRILGFDWIPGPLLQEKLNDVHLDQFHAIGKTLAEFHLQSRINLAPITSNSEITALFNIAHTVTFLLPNLSSRAKQIARQLVNRIAERPGIYFPTHGDFYARQIILSDNQIAFLDLDEAVLRDPASDLGNFIAHLEFDALNGVISKIRAAEITDALIEGYATRVPSSMLIPYKLYSAVALFRLASDPFRFRDSRWPEKIASILDRAESLIASVPKQNDNESRAHALVSDPFNAAKDPVMPFLTQALDPSIIQNHFDKYLPFGKTKIERIEVVRYKPDRRCLIEYDIGNLALIGKVRAKGIDRSTFHLLQSLRTNGFGDDSQDSISVPEPIALLPQFRMYLLHKVKGSPATGFLTSDKRIELAQKIAEAAYKLHQADIPSSRVHTIADELRILHDCLKRLLNERPQWWKRLDRVLASCNRLAIRIHNRSNCGIHRDFYADQILVSGSRIYILDFDLYTQGDPALDIGNFLGHLSEQALRTYGDADAMLDVEDSLEDRYLQLNLLTSRNDIQIYKLLTMARHIYLSTLFAERHAFTEPLLQIVEERLSKAERALSAHISMR